MVWRDVEWSAEKFPVAENTPLQISPIRPRFTYRNTNGQTAIRARYYIRILFNIAHAVDSCVLKVPCRFPPAWIYTDGVHIARAREQEQIFQLDVRDKRERGRSGGEKCENLKRIDCPFEAICFLLFLRKIEAVSPSNKVVLRECE